MTKRSKRRGLHEWTSLSMLASAAFAGGPATAYAAIISHGPTALPVSLPGGNSITIHTGGSYFIDSNVFQNANATRSAGVVRHTYSAGLKGVTFAAHFAAKGQTFNQIGSDKYQSFRAQRVTQTNILRMTARTNASHPNLSTVRLSVLSHMGFATRNYHVSTSGGTVIRASGSRVRATTNPLPYSDEYALFRFDAGSQTDYGWLELSLDYPTTGGPAFTIDRYAYDTSGMPLPAGFVPEPQDLPLALSALTLGALGLREWRKGRRQPTSAAS